MAMSRSFGGTLLTTRPPMEISPLVMFSSPASMRSRVDLPQPDGPTSTTNSPSAMSTLTPCSTLTEPKALRALRMSTVAIRPPVPATRRAAVLELGDLCLLRGDELQQRRHALSGLLDAAADRRHD